MNHVRIFKHYIHTPFLVLAMVELVVLVGCAYVGYGVRLNVDTFSSQDMLNAVVFATSSIIGMVAMGVYESRPSEGLTAMMLRSAVGLFLIGNAIFAVLTYLAPPISIGRGVLLVSNLVAIVAITLVRWGALSFIAQDSLKTRVLVLGTGRQALKIAVRMRRSVDRVGFVVVGFVQDNPELNLIGDLDDTVIQLDQPLVDYCLSNSVEEVVVAVDERRRNRPGGGGIPIDELLECRLKGINVCDVNAFVEREGGKVDVEMLNPSWMVFSDGFISTSFSLAIKRVFDLMLATMTALVAIPLMLGTALSIWIESGFRGPILYRQTRVGIDGKEITILKFRSMRTDAEGDGVARWATRDDDRVTRVGRLIRRTRIDELPQLYNVLKGDMSFVGPRPERPEFVAELAEQIPYYDYRHNLKPGLTGWAQLCYPYGASVKDAREKLQYDLYYMKNRGLLLDLVILIQTAEVVLIGEGAH